MQTPRVCDRQGRACGKDVPKWGAPKVLLADPRHTGDRTGDRGESRQGVPVGHVEFMTGSGRWLWWQPYKVSHLIRF